MYIDSAVTTKNILGWLSLKVDLLNTSRCGAVSPVGASYLRGLGGTTPEKFLEMKKQNGGIWCVLED